MSLTRTRTLGRLALLLLSGLVAQNASAHHSAAMFDFTKCLMLTGTVRTLEWNFPHTWLWVTVPQGQADAGIWGFESGSPASLTRKGWSRDVLKPGDKVTVKFFPLKSGQQGGNMATVHIPDGHDLPSVPFPCDAPQPAKAK